MFFLTKAPYYTDINSLCTLYYQATKLPNLLFITNGPSRRVVKHHGGHYTALCFSYFTLCLYHILLCLCHSLNEKYFV